VLKPNYTNVTASLPVPRRSESWMIAFSWCHVFEFVSVDHRRAVAEVRA